MQDSSGSPSITQMVNDSGLVREVVGQLGLSRGAERVQLGQSNEVWIGSDWVLRVGGADDSLLTEAKVVAQLPAAVGYPRVIGVGRTGGRCWMVAERLAGQNLELVWPHLTAPARVCAIRDLWARVSAVHATDLTRLPTLNATPLYALTPATAQKQIAVASPTIGHRAADRLSVIVAEGFDALDQIDQALVHSDAALGNAVWDGRAAVPVDFEFACVGPMDLDLERLARETANTDEVTWRDVGSDIILAAVRNLGGAARLRCYAVLFDLWAYGKWFDNAPTATDKESWAPTRNLIAAADGKSWTDRAINDLHA